MNSSLRKFLDWVKENGIKQLERGGRMKKKKPPKVISLTGSEQKQISQAIGEFVGSKEEDSPSYKKALRLMHKWDLIMSLVGIGSLRTRIRRA